MVYHINTISGAYSHYEGRGSSASRLYSGDIVAPADAYFKDYEHYVAFWRALKNLRVSSRKLEQHVTATLHLAQSQGAVFTYPILDMAKIHTHWDAGCRNISLMLQSHPCKPNFPKHHCRDFDWLRPVAIALQCQNYAYRQKIITWSFNCLDEI